MMNAMREVARYDASTAPDPQAWLELDEQERIELVIAYHRRYHLPMGQDPKMHGVAHVIVENQVAMGDATVVPATLARLMREGLNRHDAIHAIGSVLMVSFSTWSRRKPMPGWTSTRDTVASLPS
jgi:hypothetical protein